MPAAAVSHDGQVLFSLFISMLSITVRIGKTLPCSMALHMYRSALGQVLLFAGGVSVLLLLTEVILLEVQPACMGMLLERTAGACLITLSHLACDMPQGGACTVAYS